MTRETTVPPQDGPSSKGYRGGRRALLLALPWVALAFLLTQRPPSAEPTRSAPVDATRPSDGPTPRDGRLTVLVVSDTGDPLPGVRIEVASAGVADDTFSATTGAEGRASLDHLPVGRADVLAWLDGMARGWSPADIAAQPTKLRIVLGPGASLRGVVVDEAGDPIAHARVEVRSTLDEPAPPWTATTDDDGRFTLTSLRPGPQRVEVVAEGYERIGQRLDSRTDEEVRVVLRRTGAIAGQVLGPDGRPHAGATVVLAGSGVWPPRSLDSGPDGNFSFEGVPGGIYEVRARHDDLVADPREGIALTPGGHIDLTLRLASGAALLGRVIARDGGAPIENAEVVATEEALAFQPLAATTDAEGRFALEGLRDLDHQIGVRALGYVAIHATAHPGGDAEVTFALVRAGVVEGIVLDALDAPVPGASVEVVGTGDDGQPVAWSGADATFQTELFAAELAGATPVLPSGELGVTLGEVPPLPLAPGADAATPAASGSGFVADAEGRFRIEGVPPGRLQVVGSHAEHAPGITPPFVLVAGGTVDGVTLVLPEGGRIDGRVVDERGFPVSLARVEIACEREHVARWALAGEDGVFEVEGALGTTVLTAHPAGRPVARATVEVESGETVEVELRVEGELTALRARVVDNRGFPVAGARVTARSLRPGAMGFRSAWSGDDGTVEIPGIAPPPWRVEADHEDYAPRTLANVRTEDEIRLTLEPGASVVGRVVDAWSLEPVARAEVRLDVSGEPRSTFTDAEGVFELSRVPAGDHVLHVEAEGLLATDVSAGMSLRRGRVEDLDVGDVSLAAGGAVAGEVVDALGSTVSGAEVAAGEPPAWARAVRSDPEGAFRIVGLAPGPAVLTARHPAAGQSEPVTVQIRARDEAVGPRIHLPERFDPERTTTEAGTGLVSGVAIDVRARGATVRVASVRSGSEAESAGVRAGDVLVAVDDEPVVDAAQAARMLRGPTGVEVVLDLRRGPRDLRLVVPRETWQD